jgi:hypothetical protein
MNLVEKLLLGAVQDFWSRQLLRYGHPWQPGMIRRFHRPWPAQDVLVAELHGDLRFVLARTAAVLLRPDVDVATTIAENLAPAPYGDEISLVRDLIVAAGAPTQKVRDHALLSGATAVTIALIKYGDFGDLA